MDVSGDQKTTTQEEERDLLQEAIRNYDPNAPPSSSELERAKKNKASSEYYRANKDKILAAKKSRKTIVSKEKCIQEGIPDYFAEYLQFRSNGEIHLVCSTTQELKRILYWIKFKSEFGEDIFPTNNK